MAMYMQPEPFEQAHAGMRIGRWAGAAVAVSVAGLLLLGIRPNRLLDWQRRAATGWARAGGDRRGAAAPNVDRSLTPGAP